MKMDPKTHKLSFLPFHHEEDKMEPYSDSWMHQADILHILLHGG